MANKKVPLTDITVREHLFYAYANLAMAHTAVVKGQEKYERFNFMVRARLYKGLLTGTMNIRTLFDDEKIKLSIGTKCNYCNSTEQLALDHILAQKLGGKDVGDNLIYACKICNSSKGKKDLMEWMSFRGEEFLPLMVIRRYLKLVINYCVDNDLMDLKLSDNVLDNVPFKLILIPINYPSPHKLRLV
ncbi:MAG TPA: hypothetical protein DCO83_09155 [Mucilaginibacter sp.]|jgi:hypothetical protein|nr:hypothetical protein [Mucilaginibacter sp.]